MENSKQVQITFNLELITKPVFEVLEQTSQFIHFGIQLLENIDDLKDNDDQTDEMFTAWYIGNPKENLSIAEKKDRFKLWILQKACEDLIKGINLCLMDTYFLACLIQKKDGFKNYEDFHEEMIKSRTAAHEASLPTLLSKIKPILTGDLKYESEIRSINKFRNCLVHRNGKIGEKDISDKENQRLTVEYHRMTPYYFDGENNIEVKKFTLIPGGAKIQVTLVKEYMHFNLGETVNVNFSQFNSLITTCMVFSQDLLQKFPKN